MDEKIIKLLSAILDELKSVSKKLDDIHDKADWAQHHASGCESSLSDINFNLDSIRSLLKNS